MLGRLGQELELGDRARALAHGVADAVGAGVAAADHDDVLAAGADLIADRGLGGRRLGSELARDPAVALIEVVHREVHAVELAARHRQVARHARAGRQHDRVIALAQLVDLYVGAHVDAAAELDALGCELLDAALNDALLDLEVRHAEAHEPADRLVALEQRHTVARSALLLRRRHARGTRTDDRDRLAGLAPGRLRRHPAFVPGAVDDRVLDLFDRDRFALPDLEHARRLAWCRAQATGELGEVVRRVQLDDRVAKAVAIDEVVPVGDEVAQRTAVVTERHAAVHTAGALLAQLRHRPLEQELAIVAGALARLPIGDAVALDLKEPAELAHQAPVPPTASSGRDAAMPPFSAAFAARASSSARCLSTRL